MARIIFFLLLIFIVPFLLFWILGWILKSIRDGKRAMSRRFTQHSDKKKSRAKIPDQLVDRLIVIGGVLGAFIFLCLISFLIIDSFFNIDTIRHRISDKKHNISNVQVERVLGYQRRSNSVNVEQARDSLHAYLSFFNEESRYSLDSLFTGVCNDDYNSGLVLLINSIKFSFPVELQNFLTNRSLSLAKTKYQTILPILEYYRSIKDYDGVMSCYKLAKSWKWDIDISHGSPGDNRHEERELVLTNSLAYAVLILDEKTPVSDSVARTIMQHCKAGLKVNPNTKIFWDKLTEYAYKVGDPKADKYADRYLNRSRGWDFPFSDYSFHIDDRGGAAEGYYKRFFSDPLFLRYKSSLKQKKYKRARHILDLLSSETEDYVPGPDNPYELVSDTLSYAYRDNNDENALYSLYDLATISENARLRFLTKDYDFGDWAVGAFVTGARYLSPNDGYMGELANYLFGDGSIRVSDLSPYMAINYNNPDPRWVYNTALFIKGASSAISGSLEKAIIRIQDKQIIEEMKSLKREHVFSSAMDKEGNDYLSFNQSIESRLEKNLKESLGGLFYSFSDIQEALYDNECAVEFVKAPSLDFGEDVYKAVILRHGYELPIMITLGESSNINQLFISRSPSLYEIVWKPLEEYIYPGDIVFFSTDGILSLVNIGSLENSEGERVSDYYDIRQCVSTKTILDYFSPVEHHSIALFGGMDYDESPSEQSHNNGVTAYRSPSNPYANQPFEFLSGTEKEVSTINISAKRHGLQSKAYIESNGTEYNFKDLTGGNYSIIHIATHGFYYDAQSTKNYTFFEKMEVNDNPLNRCGLLFSGGNKAWKGESIPDNAEDGILLGSEIARMDLSNTDLVVLSACNTGLGDISEEGVSGLQMAFKRAGVKSILMTLGKVDDEATAFFMNLFYDNLFSGKDKHSAYESAIRSMRESEKYREPKYWAQFVLID